MKPDNEQQNLHLIQRYWDEIWTAGNLDAIAELYDPECRHGAAFSIEGFQRNVARWRQAFPDWAARVDDAFAVGDKVVSRVTYHGTHRGVFAGLQPTERLIEVTGLDVFRIRDAKIVEHWHEADHFALFDQLGFTLVPPSGSSEISPAHAS